MPAPELDRSGISNPTLSPPLAMRYALLGDLKWRDLDGEWVIFSVKSGSLLQADAMTAALCSLLEHQAATAVELLGQIADSIEMPPDAALLDSIERALSALHDASFVEILR